MNDQSNNPNNQPAKEVGDLSWLAPEAPVTTGKKRQATSYELYRRFKNYFILAIGLAALLLVLLLIVFVKNIVDSKTNKNSYNLSFKEGQIDQRNKDRQEFIDKANQPYQQFRASDLYGGFIINIPKTWSITQGTNDKNAVSMIANPNNVDLTATRFALRVNLENTSYNDAKDKYFAITKDKQLQSSVAYSAVTVSGIDGYKFSGNLTGDANSNINMIVVILPLRDKTLVIQTDNSEFYGDIFGQVLAQSQIKP